jgi:hypothetical protein
VRSAGATSPLVVERIEPGAEMSKFLFVHIAKTAGTSFTALLTTLFEPGEIAPFLGGAKPTFEERKPEYRLYAGHYQVYDALRHFPDCV